MVGWGAEERTAAFGRERFRWHLPHPRARREATEESAARGGRFVIGRRLVDRSSLPVFAHLLVAFKLRSHYRLSHYVSDRVLEFLLLSIRVEAHEHLNGFFGIHGAMVAQSRPARLALRGVLSSSGGSTLPQTLRPSTVD